MKKLKIGDQLLIRAEVTGIDKYLVELSTAASESGEMWIHMDKLENEFVYMTQEQIEHWPERSE